MKESGKEIQHEKALKELPDDREHHRRREKLYTKHTHTLVLHTEDNNVLARAHTRSTLTSDWTGQATRTDTQD